MLGLRCVRVDPANGGVVSELFARSDLNGWVLEFLGEHADPVLGESGFVRRASSRSARRRTDYGSQKVEFLVFSRPRYAPDMAHLYLHSTFHMPELMDLARKIFGADRLSSGRDVSVACGVALDSMCDVPVGMWLFQDRSGLDDLASAVQGTLATKVLPYLNATNTETTFVTGPTRGRARVEVIAAAYVHLGRAREAVDYLRARAGNETDLEISLLTPEARHGLRGRRRDALNQLERYLDSSPPVSGASGHS